MRRFARFGTIWTVLNMWRTPMGDLLLVKLQAEACNFNKTYTPPWVFSTFLYYTNDTSLRRASHICEGVLEIIIQWKCILESCFTHTSYIAKYYDLYTFRICDVWLAHDGTDLFSSVVERKRHFEVTNGWVIRDFLIYCMFFNYIFWVTALFLLWTHRNISYILAS